MGRACPQGRPQSPLGPPPGPDTRCQPGRRVARSARGPNGRLLKQRGERVSTAQQTWTRRSGGPPARPAVTPTPQQGLGTGSQTQAASRATGLGDPFPGFDYRPAACISPSLGCLPLSFDRFPIGGFVFCIDLQELFLRTRNLNPFRRPRQQRPPLVLPSTPGGGVCEAPARHLAQGASSCVLRLDAAGASSAGASSSGGRPPPRSGTPLEPCAAEPGAEAAALPPQRVWPEVPSPRLQKHSCFLLGPEEFLFICFFCI